MKWIKRKLHQWVTEGARDGSVGVNKQEYLISADQTDSVNDDPVLNFRVFAAQNGMILEFRHYNRKTDRHNTSTFIVPEGEDVSEYVRQCLPMELMKVER